MVVKTLTARERRHLDEELVVVQPRNDAFIAMSLREIQSFVGAQTSVPVTMPLSRICSESPGGSVSIVLSRRSLRLIWKCLRFVQAGYEAPTDSA